MRSHAGSWRCAALAANKASNQLVAVARRQIVAAAQPVALHLFVEGAARQLQLVHHLGDVAAHKPVAPVMATFIADRSSSEGSRG